MAINEILYEFICLGNCVKGSAIDSRRNIEVSMVFPKGIFVGSMERHLKRKLMHRLSQFH